ncbi:uncharacterized protein LOC130718995 [Lotus japonicus]|uniref:uncharacterized protein LOC130718995 n=1 Tax=Lotus japonicus TaxID=34305 RepID=UPI00258D9DD3|nr:uncharacterized protein LOC130718995 [Lotus japonicus]
MKRALVSKNKFRFVSGEIPVPTATDANFDAWDRCNSLIHSWILNSVTTSIANSIVFVENACDAWRDLRDRFSQGDLVRIAELHNEISNLKQNSKSVNEYYNELKILLEELDHYRSIPQCKCTVPCRCDAIESVKLFREQDNAIRFLLGLNDSFGVVKSQILMSHPLPPLAKVVSLATQHERQTDIEEKGDSLARVNAAAEGKKQPYGRGQSGGSSYRNTGKFCTHCKKSGHTVDVCHRLHGYPTTFNNRYGSNGTSQVNNTARSYDTEDPEDDDCSQRDNEELFTADQYKKIIAMIQQVSTSKKSAESNNATVNHVVKTAACEGDTSGHGNPLALSCYQQYDSRDWII